MKTKLTQDIENCFMKEFSTMGNFICPEVGINIRRFGFPKRYYRITKLAEQELLDKGFTPNWHIDTEIVDMLLWQSNKNIWKCFEIKISYSDFKSSAAKTFVGNYNYYILPDTLISQVEYLIPKEIGIYSYATVEPQYSWENRFTNYRKGRKQELGCTQDEIYYGMIKSLYRELQKYRGS